MSPIPRPENGFLDSQIRISRRGGARWRNEDGSRLWEWDSLHGHIEGYTKRGHHIGVFDAMTGERIGAAVAGRKIDV
ncbi:colicin E3/pyocin S6 family cytotoxin [Paenarthrobacter ilicis]|uniref:colicin E3/pyocin S6 family cytotoxin n=1 Tax=Paenarthrobacter ilicis TaxID=43665 RepID=UPI003AB441A5